MELNCSPHTVPLFNDDGGHYFICEGNEDMSLRDGY